MSDLKYIEVDKGFIEYEQFKCFRPAIAYSFFVALCLTERKKTTMIQECFFIFFPNPGNWLLVGQKRNSEKFERPLRRNVVTRRERAVVGAATFLLRLSLGKKSSEYRKHADEDDYPTIADLTTRRGTKSRRPRAGNC